MSFAKSETATSPPALALPTGLASQGFSLRPETESDIPFLLVLFASTREEELARTPWSAQQKAGFLAMQFSAQRTHYRAHMSDADWIVLLHRGEPIGRIYLQWRKTSLHLIDIALTPNWRGKGIGTALMTQLLASADHLGQPINLFVERFNPAFRLYTRLGFTEVEDGGVYIEMTRAPSPGDAVS